MRWKSTRRAPKLEEDLHGQYLSVRPPQGSLLLRKCHQSPSFMVSMIIKNCHRLLHHDKRNPILPLKYYHLHSKDELHHIHQRRSKTSQRNHFCFTTRAIQQTYQLSKVSHTFTDHCCTLSCHLGMVSCFIAPLLVFYISDHHG
jgi:hypothetical protein